MGKQVDKLYKVTSYACGYYSGTEFEDIMLLTPEVYIKLKDFIENEFIMFAYELDGKHSEVQCKITVEEINFDDAEYVESESIADDLIYSDEVLDADEYEAMNNWLKENLPVMLNCEYKLTEDEKVLVDSYVESLRKRNAKQT